MKRNRIIKINILLALILTGFFISSGDLLAAKYGRDSVKTRSTLAKLNGVYVAVDVSPRAQELGLKQTQLELDVKLKLRMAGINVLTKKEFTRTPGNPSLAAHVDVLAKPGLDDEYPFSISFSLFQGVTLNRKPRVTTPAPTEI